MAGYSNVIKGMHHSAYRCKDSEQTRQFYEDLLGLRLALAMELTATATGRPVKALHTFFEMGDHSFLAFFELVGEEREGMFDSKSDFDLHIALELPDVQTQMAFLDKALSAGIEVRGPSMHGVAQSIYLRDPNGYVIELTAKLERYDEGMSQHLHHARAVLDQWQRTKFEAPVQGG
jgi:catechol 2,3-dioxygenase-like lactoylglutathione lyase family enzyme